MVLFVIIWLKSFCCYTSREVLCSGCIDNLYVDAVVLLARYVLLLSYLLQFQSSILKPRSLFWPVQGTDCVQVALLPWLVYLANVCNWVLCHAADGSQSTAFLNTCEGNNSGVTVILVTAFNYVTCTGIWDNDWWPIFVQLHCFHYVASITCKKC